MTIAAIYDLHGNLLALDAVLEEIEPLGVDRILIGGDVAFGPLVRETLDRLMELGDRCVWIRGNADRELVSFFDGGTTDSFLPDEVRRAGAWESQHITRFHRDFLAALPQHQVLNVEGLGEVLFCHGSPRSDEEIITSATSEERLRRILSGVTQKTVICGHTHVQFDRHLGDIRVVNAGSLGMPYEEPGAYWVLLGPTVELRRTLYDREQAATAFLASGHPLIETFVENLEHPTSAEEATAFFETMALRRDRDEHR